MDAAEAWEAPVEAWEAPAMPPSRAVDRQPSQSDIKPGPTDASEEAIAKGIAHADRRANKAKKKTARRGIREEGKTLY